MLSEAEKKELRKERDLMQAVRDAILETATCKHEYEGTLEIDEDAVVSMGDSGAYVQAWVYVEGEDVDLPEAYHDGTTDIWDWPTDCANPVTRQELQEALSALLKQFTISYGQDFYNNPQAKAAAILLARMQGADPIEDQTCYLRDDL